MRIYRLPSILPKRIRNIASVINGLFQAVWAVDLVTAESRVRKILAQGFYWVVTEGNETTTVGTKHAIVNGYHVTQIEHLLFAVWKVAYISGAEQQVWAFHRINSLFELL